MVPETLDFMDRNRNTDMTGGDNTAQKKVSVDKAENVALMG